MFFVLVFFFANVITQALVPDIRKKNIVMLAFSLVFYAWAGLRGLVLMLVLTLLCWYSALLISRRKIQREKKSILIVCTTLVLLALGIFKYTGFLFRNLGFPDPGIILPIGISFYTFQLLSYVIDVYRGDAEVQEKYWLLLLYASLFHQCVAGPIVRYRDVNHDILHRKVKMAELSRGITRFAIGLAKKAVLANGCDELMQELLKGSGNGLANCSVLALWLVMIVQTLYIYLDFSAYSDMAIGMGLMCGFHYKENFNYPYTADSVTDFWRRWHISLSTFFRDYVYIPLGGNRCSKSRHILNLLVVWGLTGMWHGASWNYILWGLYYFVFLVIEKYKVDTGRIAKPLRHVITMLIVMFGWVIFKFRDIGQLWIALKGMIGLNGNEFTAYSSSLLFENNVFFLIICILAVTPISKYIGSMLKNLSRRSTAWLHVYNVLDAALPVVLLFLSMITLAGLNSHSFLYSQF